MLGSLNALLAATVAFVGGHFLLSSAPLRTPLVKTFGPGGFTPLYALLVGAAFVWMLTAYGAAPAVVLWYPPPALRWVPLLVMPFALFLAVAGLTTPSPTLVGGENVVARAAGTPHRLVGGIFTVTRHPFLWGTTLWAVSHLLANGTVADVILMGGILVLSLAGMRHIDRRREAALGVGASPVQTMIYHVLPLAMPGMLTGTIIGMAQALGETAPLLMIGMVAFIANVPATPLDSAAALPVQIYLWAESAERGFVEKTAAAIMVIMTFLFLMNLVAVIIRSKTQTRVE